MRHRRLWKNWLSGVGLALAAGAASAQDVKPAGGPVAGPVGGPVAAPCCPTVTPPLVPCPPAGQPAQPGAPAEPTAPLDTGALTAPAAGGFAEAPSAGTGGPASLAPNMMGDLLGARSVSFGTTRQLVITFANPQATPGGLLVPPGSVTGIQINPITGGQPYTASPAQIQSIAAQLAQLDPYFQAVNGANIPPQQAAAAQAILQATLSGRNLTPQEIASLPPNIQAQLPRIQNAINSQLTQATHGLTVPNVVVSGVNGTLQGNSLQYTALLTAQTTVPLPGNSTSVGRIKLSEDNNPLPRDRVIFDYDNFSGVPFTADGMTVNRYQFGVEKTFFDGRGSFETRLPFATTLASTFVQGRETTSTELGNLRFALKYLWLRSQYVYLSSGTGVTLPTASNQNVYSADPTQGLLYQLRNQSVQVEPFVAVLLTPTDRLFGQVWSSVNFDASGSRLNWNTNVFGGSGTAHIWDLPILAVDGQLGYWLFRSDTAAIRGLAPFLELHWNYVIAQDRLVRELNNRVDANGLTVGNVPGRELNLTAGATTQIGNNLLVTAGGSAPLLSFPNRTFDGQFGLRVNYFFGRTALQRGSPYAVQGF